VLSQTRKKIKAQESNRQQAMLEQSSNNDSNPNCYSGNAPAPEKKQKNRKYRQQQAVEAPLERKKKTNVKQPRILQQQSAEVLFTEEHQP
jgi:hypothetical protein